MTDNWYLILELPYEPTAEEDESVIENRINEKQNEWSRDSQKGFSSKGKLASDYLGKIEIIKRDMIGENNIRKELIQDAKARKWEKLDKILEAIPYGKIKESKIDVISKRVNLSRAEVEERLKEKNFTTIQNTEEDYKKIYSKYLKKPKNLSKYKNVDSDLKIFNCKTLYEFLFQDETIKNPEKLSSSDLLNQSNKIKKKFQSSKADKGGPGLKICGLCDDVFKDDANRKSYDTYLDYSKLLVCLKRVEHGYDMSGDFSFDEFELAIDSITKSVGSPKIAKEILIAHCKEKQIELPDGAIHLDKSKNSQVCVCGRINDLSDGHTNCPHCGKPLKINCPQCQTPNINSNEYCVKCNFELKKIDQVEAKCQLAQSRIDALDFDYAKQLLDSAKQILPNYVSISPLSEAFNKKMATCGNLRPNLLEACEKKNFFKAKQILSDIKKNSDTFSEPELEEQIKFAVTEADKYRKTALNSSKVDDVLDACSKAVSFSADCPNVSEIANKYPPETPTNLKVTINSVSKSNILTWDKISSGGTITYVVIRKENSAPVSPEDGTLVAEVGNNSVNDINLKTAIDYYYAVYAKRAGVYSSQVLSDKVCNYFDITGVEIAPGDSSLKISWDPLPSDCKVQIRRQAPQGSVDTFYSNNKLSYLDEGLVNDNEYRYHVCLEYQTSDGSKFLTEGMSCASTPIQPPVAIEDVYIKPKADSNTFEITWECEENSDIKFYLSKNKPFFSEGDSISLDKLEQEMEPLLVDKISSSSGTFDCSEENMIYVVAVVPKMDTVTIGKIAKSCRGGDIRFNIPNEVNGKIFLSFKKPKNAIGFLVLYRNDDYVDDIEDKNANRKSYTLKEFEANNGLYINSCNSLKYFISVFVKYNNAGEIVYSGANNLLFDNSKEEIIYYSIKVNKKLFGDSNFVISFECPSENFQLPAVDICFAVGHSPMFHKMSDIFYRIDEGRAGKVINCEIPVPKNIPKNTHIKPFIENDNLSKKFVFRKKQGNNEKIS